MQLEVVSKRWPGATAIVAATGPSLTAAVAESCRGEHVIAVNDAYKLFPFAEVLYACDARWWTLHKGCPAFAGEKWSSHGKNPANDKTKEADAYGLHVVAGKNVDGFSFDPSVIHYGNNSGYQAVNLAILFGATKIVLVGFDMRQVSGRLHFFGNHPAPLVNRDTYRQFIAAFDKAKRLLPKGIEILNATPESALKCFPALTLADALRVEAMQ